MIPHGPPPRFPSSVWLSAAQRRWRAAEYADARAALDADCASDLAWLPAVPGSRAGHYHDYFCPDHAVQLRFQPDEAAGHACPVDDRRFAGEPFDTARLWLVNNLLSRAAFRLSLRAALDPSAGTAARDRRRAWEILAGYLNAFPPVAADGGGLEEYPGIIGYSGLDDSVWLVRVTWAYGLLTGRLSDRDRERFRTGLLEPMSTHLRRIRCPPTWPPVDNIAVWNDAAMVVAATVLGDDDGLAHALQEPLALRDQLARGVRPGGLWWEGSVSYHFYTLAATVWAVRALMAAGRGFEDHQLLRRMFAAPLGVALPDLSLPAMNDGWYGIRLTGEVGHDIPDAAGFYVTAHAWYGDEAFADVVRANFSGRPRDSIELLLDGTWRDDAPQPTSEQPDDDLQRAVPSGLAVLRPNNRGSRRQRQASQSMAILKAGPSGGSHGHPDQLSLQFYAAEERILDDLGTTGYGVALNESWFRTTASHNTLVVDGQSQPLADGDVTAWREADRTIVAVGTIAWPATQTASGGGGPYAGLEATRHVALAQEYLLDVLEVAAGQPRALDWVLLPRGKLAWPRKGVPTADLGTAAGYAHVENPRRIAPNAAPLRWNIGKRSALEIHWPAVDEDVETLIVGSVPGNPATERIGILVRRRHAYRTRYLALLVPFVRGRRLVRSVVWAPDASDGVGAITQITTDRGVDSWELRDGRLHQQRD